MKSFQALAVYLAVVCLGAAALAPWVYLVAQKLAVQFSVFDVLAGQPFHRYVNRCLYAAALAGLWPLLRRLGLRSIREIGFANPIQNWRRAFAGFGIGFATLASVATLALLSGARQPNAQLNLQELASHLINATTSCLAVAVLEEFLFRGVVFGGLRKSVVPAIALILSSALYSAVHFYERPPTPEHITWASGFETFGLMFHGITKTQTLIPGFFSLLIAGGILCWSYHSTGTLWFSVGLHAGWVFWLKSYAKLTQEAPGYHESLWGTNKLYDGWIAFGSIGLTALLLRWRFPPPRGVIQWK